MLYFRRCSIAQAGISKKLSPKGLGQLGKSLPFLQVGIDLCPLTFTNPTTPDTAHSLTIYTKCFKGLKMVHGNCTFVTYLQQSPSPFGTLEPSEWVSKGMEYYHHYILEKSETLSKTGFQSRAWTVWSSTRITWGHGKEFWLLSSSVPCHQSSLSSSGKVRVEVSKGKSRRCSLDLSRGRKGSSKSWTQHGAPQSLGTACGHADLTFPVAK